MPHLTKVSDFKCGIKTVIQKWHKKRVKRMKIFLGSWNLMPYPSTRYYGKCT